MNKTSMSKHSYYRIISVRSFSLWKGTVFYCECGPTTIGVLPVVVDNRKVKSENKEW